MAEYDQYCNLPGDSPWVPTLPGLPTEGLPAAPAPEQGTANPPNSAPIPPGFNEENPNLCEIFNDIVPGPSDPDYEDYYDNPPVIPPFNEAVYINCSIRIATVSDFLNWPVSAKDEDLFAQIGTRILPDGGIEANNNLITIPGLYSQSSLYAGAELADYESMSNGLDSETLKTVTNADFEAWIQIDLAYDTYIAQLEIGCDFNGLLPGGFGKWAADFALIQWKADGAAEWTELDGNIGEFTAPVKYHYVGQTCRYIRIIQYGRNLAITEFAVKSDRWIAPLFIATGINSSFERNIPINQNLVAGAGINTSPAGITFTPDKLLYLVDFESAITSGGTYGVSTKSWHSVFTRYWNFPSWPPDLTSASSPIIGTRSLIMPDHPTSNYAMRFSYTPYFNMEDKDWHIKLYCTPATVGTEDGYGNFYQYLLSLASLIRIGIDDEGYYFFEVINTAGGSSQLVGGKFKDGNSEILAVNNQPICVVASCEADEFSIWLNGQKKFAEPKTVAMPGLSKFSISYNGYDCYIGAKDSTAAVGDANMFRGGKIDHIAIYKGVAYYEEADPFLSPTPLPSAQPTIPQFIAPLDALNSGYFASASAGLTAQNSASRVLAVPTHAENDLLIALIHYRKPSSEIIPPLGWVLENGDIGSELLQYGKDARIHIYSRVARDDEELSYAWTSATGSAINAGLIVAVRNGIITQVENKTAPVLTTQELEGFPTYYTFDYEPLHFEARFDELLIAGNCRTWTSGYPERQPSLLRIDNSNPRTGLRGPRTKWAFPVELLNGPGAVVGYGANGADSMNLFAVKLKLGQPVPRYVVARILRPKIGISNAIEIIKTVEWTPSEINPNLEVWLDSLTENPYVLVSNEIDIWKDQTIHQRDFRAQYLDYGGSVNDASYRPFLAPRDNWSGAEAVQFAPPDTIGAETPKETWDFLATGPYHFITVAQMGIPAEQVGASQSITSYLISTAHFAVYWYRYPYGPEYKFYVSIYGNDYRAGQLYERVVAEASTQVFPVPEMQKAIIEVYGDATNPTLSERIKVAVNGVELALTRSGSYPAGILPDDSRRQLSIGRNGGTTGIFHAWIVCSRELNADDRQKALGYLAKKHKMTELLPADNPCRENVAKADSVISESSILKFTTSPVTFTPAPVAAPIYADSFANTATARTSAIAPIFSDSYCPEPTVLIYQKPISLPAVYSQSSIFTEYSPMAEPASALNMQDDSADETLATATGSTNEGPWVMMDFTKIVIISSVTVGTDLNRTLLVGGEDYWGGWDQWYTTGAIVEISSDAQNWTTAVANVDGFSDQEKSILEFPVAPGTTCRYMRIGYPYNSGFYFAVTEFYATGSFPAEPLAEFVSSESYCLPAVAVITEKIPAAYSQSSLWYDNELATQSGMQNNSAGETLQTGTNSDPNTSFIVMDFGNVKSFSAIVVGCDFNDTLAGGWGKTYTENAAIEISSDKVSWTQIGTTGLFSQATQEYQFSGQSARYVRISRPAWNYLAATEFYAKF